MKLFSIFFLVLFSFSTVGEVRLDGDSKIVSIDLRNMDQLKNEISNLIDFKGQILSSRDLKEISDRVNKIDESSRYIILDLNSVDEIRFKDTSMVQDDSF